MAVFRPVLARPRRWNRRAELVAAVLCGSCLTLQSVRAQQAPAEPPHQLRVAALAPEVQQQPAGSPQKRTITLTDAVSIFLKENLDLLAARYDVDSADAEKITARLRPNPELSVSSEDLPLGFGGPFFGQQTYTYELSQTFELGGKRRKRIELAQADSEVARGDFQTVVWQLTNDLKKKFYAALLAKQLLDLARQNQQTFTETIKQTTDLYKAGEISGLDLERLEVEKLQFDTDVASAEGDYGIAVREVRVALGGDYKTADIDLDGSLDYQPHDYSRADLQDKALAARPDLKAAQLRETAADASIRLQDSFRIPDVSLGAGVAQNPLGTSTYVVDVGVTLPLSDRNQGERARALIERLRAQNEQRQITNLILSDVDKALLAYETQKRRVELYRTGVLQKVDEIQNLTEFSLKAGESSTLELLDAIRTRRETLASYYQTLYDYEVSLLDLELATATPLQ